MYGMPHVADTTNAMRCEYYAHIYTVIISSDLQIMYTVTEQHSCPLVSNLWQMPKRLTICIYTVSQKCTIVETVEPNIIWIDLTTYGRNYKRCIIEFARFCFHVGLLFINFSSFKPDTKNKEILKISN